MGVSADNVYYFDGINVTDPVSGTFGANLNTEIIQEQKVITGGIPAEFVGAPGLISNVITKSGSNNVPRLGQLLLPEQWPASLKTSNGAGEEFSTKDNGLHLRRPRVAGQAVVLRQLPLPEPAGRCVDARHESVPPHGGQHAAAGVRQSHLDRDIGRPPELHLPERPDRNHRPPPA